MTDKVPVMKRVKELNIAPRFQNYSKVIIYVDDENAFVAGDDSGRTLEIDNPFGSQELANRILEKLRGYQYQPYSADGAIIDPAAEIGDGVTISDVYGGLYKNSLSFSRLMAADIAAPADEEIDHEYQFESPTERKFKRELNDVKASLLITANQITAEVTELTNGKLDAQKTSSSFGWKLLSNKWSVTANGQDVFTVDSTGGTFAGKVVAASGQIGGFKINKTELTNWSGTATNARGVWMSSVPYDHGTYSSYAKFDGAVLWVGHNFWVTNDGSLHANNITANNGTFSGTIQAGTIVNGLNVNGTSWTPAQMSGGWGGGISAMQNWNNAFNSNVGMGTVYGDFRGAIYASRGLYISYGYGTRQVYIRSIEIDGTSYQVLVV